MISELDLAEYNKLFQRKLNKKREISQTEKSYIASKNRDLIDLMLELKSRGFIKRFDYEQAKRMNSDMENTINNIYHIGELYKTLISLVKNKTFKKDNITILKDEYGNSYNFITDQLVINLGITYSSSCEFINYFFNLFLDFSSMKTKKGKDVKKPNGLGELIKLLSEQNIKKMNFLNDIDTQLRNSFFHMNFEFKNSKIYCKHDNDIQSKNLGRDLIHNNQDKYITIDDLFWSLIHADRSGFPIIVFSAYIFLSNGVFGEKFLKNIQYENYRYLLCKTVTDSQLRPIPYISRINSP